MKATKYFLYITILIAMILSACGGATPTTAPQPAATQPPAASSEKVELVFWSMWNEPEPQAVAIQKWIDGFQKEHPNITIKAVWNGRENQTKLRTALGSGTKVDFMDQDADQVAGGMMSEGLGYALDDWLSQPALDENVPIKDVFQPGELEQNKAPDGHIYLWPYVNNPVMFWYNKDIFTNAGVQPPTTWDEFLAACQKIKDSGKTAIVMESDIGDFHGFWFNYLVERQKGKGFLFKTIEDKTGEMWKDPAYANAIKMIQDLWTKGYFPEAAKGYIWPAGQQSVATGEAAMELVGGWLPTELRTATAPDFKWGGFRFPAISGGTGNVDDLHPWLLSFMILKQSEHPKEVFEFFKYIMTKENQTIMAQEALVGVTRKGVDWPASLADGATASASAKTALLHIDGGTAYHPEFTKNVLYVNLTPAFMGNMTPEDFSSKMAADAKTYWTTHDK